MRPGFSTRLSSLDLSGIAGDSGDSTRPMPGFNAHYSSFKIFPQFWLAKSTSIITHNQLLMTKFGRILCLSRKWLKKCSLLQVNAQLTEKTWGRDWVVFVVKTKMADTTAGRTTELQLELGKIMAKNIAKTARWQLGGRHLLFRECLRSWTNLTYTIEDKLNIDAGKHVLAVFLN